VDFSSINRNDLIIPSWMHVQQQQQQKYKNRQNKILTKHPKSINGQPSNYKRVIARIVPFICIVKPNPLLKLVSISSEF